MAVVKRKSETIAKFFIHIFFCLLSVTFIIPIWSIVSISFMSEKEIIQSGYAMIPKELCLTAYKYIFSSTGAIINAYKATIITSVMQCVLFLIVGSMCAYAISRSDFKFRGPITFFMFFTMLFGGGMIPSYILIAKVMNLTDTYAALVFPSIGNVWSIFIIRTFFQQLPGAIIESATIDGASEWTIFTKIILPLSTPALATMGLLEFLGAWNAWMPSMLYLTSNGKDKRTLQYLLQTMLRNIDELKKNQEQTGMILETANTPTESARMAMAVVAVGPILLIFPFFQKYFVQGLTVGSVKG